MSKEPCDGCPENKCRRCPVVKDLGTLTLGESDIELALQNQANFGAAETMYLIDPDTDEVVFVDTKNPSPRAVELVNKIFNNILVSVKVDE